MSRVHVLTNNKTWFPNPTDALDEPDGLLAIGGDLSTERIYAAYQQGIFPWYSDGEPIMWWSPCPRAVVYPNQININKSLRKFLNKCQYSVTVNNAFNQVIKSCAKPRRDNEGTWITSEMIKAYIKLNQIGLAHSIEIWQIIDEKRVLVGGLYGVLIGNCFCGESMFSIGPNASKLALLVLGKLLLPYNGLIDCQLPNPYLMDMGAKLLSRELYLDLLADCKQQNIPKQVFDTQDIYWHELDIIRT